MLTKSNQAKKRAKSYVTGAGPEKGVNIWGTYDWTIGFIGW